MKRILFLLLLAAPFHTFGQEKPKTPATLKSILLEQLRTTHNVEDWFVPVNIALQGVTADQAKWTPGPGDHSVGQLANHLLFWNTHDLASSKARRLRSSTATTTRPSTTLTRSNGTKRSRSSTRC